MNILEEMSYFVTLVDLVQGYPIQGISKLDIKPKEKTDNFTLIVQSLQCPKLPQSANELLVTYQNMT